VITVAIIQARLGSTRFPRKVLADLNGKPIVQHVYERAWQIKDIDAVDVCVPEFDLDTFLAQALPVFFSAVIGVSEDDVLRRYLCEAAAHNAEVVMRITGDCPALDPVVAGKVLDLFYASQPCDFASNDTTMSGYPDGFDCAVFSHAALERAAARATDPQDREHIECWFKRPENGMRCVTLMNPESWTGPKKLSVDTPEDLETVKQWLAGAQSSGCSAGSTPAASTKYHG
jgi:spore coat polysaccharide biosynthesis protein SpsF (cytidylyltransferase family)